MTQSRKVWKSLIVFTIVVIAVYMFWKWANNIQVWSFDSGVAGPNVLVICGTHGNEPAGRVVLEEWVRTCQHIKRGKLFVIPCANKSGNFFGVRTMLQSPFYPDLNRNYTSNGKEAVSQQIIKLIHTNEVNFILDFHEGWGYHLQEESSVGSTLAPISKLSYSIAKKCIAELNESITDDDSHLFSLNTKKDNFHTLRNYARRNGIDYILVETTGQKDIQPLSVRCEQVEFILNFVLKSLGTI